MSPEIQRPSPLLEQHLDGIRELCRVHSVETLHAFGSVLRPDFGTKSDVDFLVQFDRRGCPSAFRQFFDFKEALERLLEHEVDLVTSKSIRNPFFKRTVEETKMLVYAA